MHKHIGLWIDHREAVMVSVTGEGEEVKRIASGLERQVRFSGNAEPLTAEDMLDRRYANHLNQFFQKLVAALRDAEAILIMGPGEAKGELAKQLQAANLGGRVMGIETVDKLTERQIAARVRAWCQQHEAATKR